MFEIVGMDRAKKLGCPTGWFRRDACVAQRTLIPVIGTPLRIGDDNAYRQTIEQLMEAGFTPMLQRFTLLQTKLRGLPPDHLLFFVEFDKDRDLATQDFRL